MKSQFGKFMSSDSVLTLDVLTTFTKTQQNQIRRLIQTDVWFAAQHIFRDPKNLPLEDCHRQICDALVQPNPDVDISQWDATKERAILCFRGCGKTTIDVGHAVQIILSAPDCRLLFVGGTVAHAQRKMQAVVDIFNCNAVIQHLFPNFTNVSAKLGTFTTPARTTTSLKEATITCASFRSSTASGHYDWLKLDDAINDQNQRTDAAVAKSVDSFDNLSPLLEPDTYTDFIGVRFDARDIPAQMATRSIDNRTPLIWLEIPVFQLKEGEDLAARHKANKLNLDTDVTFTWQRKWNAKTLKLPYSKPNFRENYLLEVETPEPEPLIQPVTPELLKQCLTAAIPDVFTEIPVANGDLASVSEKGTDACSVVSGYWNLASQTLTISRAFNKKFTFESDFLKQTWYVYDDLRVGRTNRIRFRVEQAKEERGLWDEEFKAIQIDAEFLPPESNKDERILELFNALRLGKVRFDSSLVASPVWSDVLTQFVGYKFGQLHSHMKDDLVDSVSQLYEFCLTITAAEPAPFHTRNAREISMFGQELGDDTFDGVHSLPKNSPQHDETFYADVDFLSRFTAQSANLASRNHLSGQRWHLSGNRNPQ